MKVVGLFAREHGLNGFQTLLNSSHEVVAVATHQRLPKNESLERSERPEFAQYVALANERNIPLFTVDSKDDQAKLEHFLLQLKYDVIASISWRRLIPMSWIEHAAYGGVNLHRGLLPNYPGAEPIKQALLNGDKSIVITAHRLDEQIDHGEILVIYEHPVHLQEGETLEEAINRLKVELSPHFGPLLLKAFSLMAS